jgi:glucose/arabinose dehydrogenase
MSRDASDDSAPGALARASTASVLVLALGLACQPARPAADAPLLDPIPEGPVVSGLTVVLEEVATMPASTPVPATPDRRLVRAARINYLGEVPDGSGRLFVPDLNGKLLFLTGGTPQEYLDVGAAFAPAFWNHRGLGSGFGFVAFHPAFASNGRFYTVHTEANAALTAKVPDWSQDNPSHHGVLTEWTAEDPAAGAFRGTQRELLRIGFRTYIHGFQQIAFDPTLAPGDDGYGLLYVAVGDGGAGPAGRAPQDLGLPHGKLLRIDPGAGGSTNGKYGIPAANPFVGRAGVLGEIYAYGLRNPHRFAWDRDGGRRRLFLGNIGEHNVESIYEVEPGDNFGWPRREGPFALRDADPTCSVYPLSGEEAGFAFTPPVAAYDHDPPPGFARCLDTGHAVIGGFVYRGRRVPELWGQYVFGDDVDGRLFHADARQMRRGHQRAAFHALTLLDGAGRTTTLQSLAGDARVDLRLGQDGFGAGAGELYVLSKANGKIWRIGRGPHRPWWR